MTASPNRARDLFLAAVRLPPDEWDPFLVEQCGPDDALRERVRDLLAAHHRAGDFLHPAAGLDATADAPAAERPGTVVGPYKLLEQLGEGGFGVVFLAEQAEPVRRKVALKVLKPGMDSKQVLARFEAERQALALMDHPNIAKVLDAGATPTGRPYFVLELVKGVPITRYCDDHHLTPRQRLELFVPVCQAVQHAHQKGIIHRDLKPSNVLVARYDDRPVPKVIDFGVAKATGRQLTEETLHTGFGAVVGTVEYMSPEQATFNQLDVDTRSDIYSLGVLLYELLAGSPPFTRKELERAGVLEMLRVIREREPARPSARLSTAEGLPALAASRGTEPAKLTRLLRGELDWIVMKALEKDRARRYETAVGFAADVQRYLADEQVLACPPSAGYRVRKALRRNKVLVTTTLLVAASLVLGTAVSAWQAAVARRAQADAAERLVRETQAREEATAVNQLLQEGLAAANPDSARGTSYTVRQLLDEIAARLGDRLRDQPAAEAAVRATIGSAYFRLGLPEQAAPHLRRALELRERLHGPDSAEVARSLYDEAFNLQEYGDVPGALARADRALAIHRAAGLRNTDTVRILWLLQLIHRRGMREDESERVGREALAIARDLPDAGGELADVLHTLADSAFLLRRDYAEADRMTRESIALHRKYHGDHHSQTGRALSHLGATLAERGRYDEAEPHLRESIAIFARNFDYISEAEVPSLAYLVMTLRGKGDPAGLESLRADVVARAKRVREHRPRDAGPLFYAALALAIVDDTDGAVDTLSQIAVHNPGKLKVWYVRIDQLAGRLASRPDSHRRYPGVALALAQQAVELGPRDGRVWQTLGIAQYRASNWPAAVVALSRSIELQTGRDCPAWLFLAMAHWQLGETETARQWYERAVRWMDQNRPKLLVLHRFRAEAEELMKQAPGPRDPKSVKKPD